MSFRVVTAFAVAWMLSVGGARAADGCPNAALRTGASAALPDCRAYELVSSDLNHSSASAQPGVASADGNTIVYGANDAPEHASSGQALSNYIRARRDPVRGWSGISLSPPLVAPITGYGSFRTLAFSTDLSSTIEVGDQPLSGGSVPAGQNLYVGRPDGTYRLITTAGSPYPSIVGGTPDFSYIFFQPTVKQLTSDPLAANNAYEWSQEHGLRLIGILEDGTPAPGGASFGGASDDGRYVAFTADNKLYLRIDGDETVEIGASQRTVDPDPNPAQTPRLVKVTADGSKVLFTSSSELTNDAYTGRSGGVATDAGRDLYSYDVATGKLTDLTVDTNPADVATGANVQSDVGNGPPVVRATPDGSHVYFIATGALTSGAVPGHNSLYVWHDGRTDLVADVDGLVRDRTSGEPSFYMTPNGRHVMFASVDPLTGYDNSDPVTGQPHGEVFTAAIGEGIECASCRPDGTRPTGDSMLSPYAKGRMMSDDGRRVFFHSTDAIIPQASNGQTQIYEYADGKVSAISRPDGPAADFRDISASGDDVFFETYDDQLLPTPNAGDSAIYDARVDGGFPTATEQDCSGIACQPPAPPAPVLAITGSVTFLGEGNAVEESARSTRVSKVTVSKIKTIAGTTGSLRVKVPGKGRVTVSGPGLRTRRSSPVKAQTVMVRLSLTATAVRTLKKKRSLRTKARVAFSDAAGRTSAVTLSVTFKAAGTTRKGR